MQVRHIRITNSEINALAQPPQKRLSLKAPNQVQFGNLFEVLQEPNTNIRLFGKGEVNGHRRLGVILARDISVDEALKKFSSP